MNKSEISKVSVEYTVKDTSLRYYSIPFKFIRKKFVRVAIEKENGKINPLTYGTDYTIVNSAINVTADLVKGDNIIIYRSTPFEPIVTWSDGSVLTANDLSLENLQLMHILEEGGASGYSSGSSGSGSSGSGSSGSGSSGSGSSGSGSSGGGSSTVDKRVYFSDINDLKDNGIKVLKNGDTFTLSGYYSSNDYGGAHYKCMYLWSHSVMPWAIDLGETQEIEYEYMHNADGTPLVSEETGEYILKTDDNGNYIPVYEEDGITPKYKHLYAVITDTTVNYAMFGAKLDGETDDYEAIKLAHQYQHDTYSIELHTGRKYYPIRIENHQGIIRKDNDTPITCCGNIDLSGSKLLYQDKNAAWYGFYLWGDNDDDYKDFEATHDTLTTFKRNNFIVKTKGISGSIKENSVVKMTSTPYAVRDDSGYLYSAPRYELLLHTIDGFLTSPITYDWDTSEGVEVNSIISDYNTKEPKPSVAYTKLDITFTRLPTTHYTFKGCDVVIESEADSYATVLWCKCHNAHITGFTFYPNTNKMQNKIFKNALIYVWGCYNVEISNIVGFNTAGKREGGKDTTSGYVLRCTNCFELYLHDMDVQGYWGATAMNCVKDTHIERVRTNRLDVHNYVQNLYIDHCILYNHSIQVGEGRGILQITNTTFYYNPCADDSYPSTHLLQLNTTYGRIFEGMVLIQNCIAYVTDPAGNELDVIKVEFSPDAVSIIDSFKFPEITIKDCYFYSYTPEAYLAYIAIEGKRNCTTSMKGPTSKKDYYSDRISDVSNNLEWHYIGKGIDWDPNINEGTPTVKAGQFIRTWDSFKDKEGRTTFYNIHYFLVVNEGVLPAITDVNKPSNYTGEVFQLGTAGIKHIERALWEANKEYKEGDYCCVGESLWTPLSCFECTKPGTSNGYRPIHREGTKIDGEDEYPKNLDACYWEYVGIARDIITKNYRSGIFVYEGDVLYADHRLYKVLKSGNLLTRPPINTDWDNPFVEGDALLQFIGKDWRNKKWWKEGAYCLSYSSDNVLQVYKAVLHSGITSGHSPVIGDAKVIDGDIIWKQTNESATKGEWKALTQYYTGDVVTNAGNNYKCIFDGRLELPQQTIIENIKTNMDVGDIFTFYEKGTSIPTKANSLGKWTISVRNLSRKRFKDFTNGYFCHVDNPQPIIIEA